MKQFIIFAGLLILLIGCKKTTYLQTDVQPQALLTTPYSFIRFWHSDTLRNNLRVNNTDSLVSYMVGDTSMVDYHGQPLYVFAIEDTTKGTIQGFLSPAPFDTAARWSKCRISPAHYIGHNQTQVITLSGSHPNIVVTSGDYWYIGR